MDANALSLEGLQKQIRIGSRHLAALQTSHGGQPLPNDAITCLTWVIRGEHGHGYCKALHEGHIHKISLQTE